jgi:hypothetical protein
MKHYSTNDKEAIARRMMPPNPVSVSMLSNETGVPTRKTG